MFCPACGNHIEDNAPFCPNCGNMIISRKQAAMVQGAGAAAAAVKVPSVAFATKAKSARSAMAGTGLNTRTLVGMGGGVAALVGSIMPWFEPNTYLSNATRGASYVAGAFGGKVTSLDEDYNLFTSLFFGNTLNDYISLISNKGIWFSLLHAIPTIMAVIAAVLLVFGLFKAFTTGGASTKALRLSGVGFIIAGICFFGAIFVTFSSFGNIGALVYPGMLMTVVGSIAAIVAPKKA